MFTFVRRQGAVCVWFEIVCVCVCVCGEMSKEDFEEGKCGLLRKAICWTRDASQNWEMECAEMMVEAAFRQGFYSACTSSTASRRLFE